MSLHGTLKFDLKRVLTICTIVMLVLTFVMMVLILTEDSMSKLDSPQALNEIINTQGLSTGTDESVDMLELNKADTKDSMIETYSQGIKNGDIALASTPPSAGLGAAQDGSVLAKSVDGGTQEQASVVVDPYQIIVSDIEAIKTSDKTVIEKYFGGSSTFSPEIVADKLAATTVTFISSEVVDEQTTLVTVHICTLDYNKMLEADKKFKQEQIEKGEVEEAAKEFSKKELAKGVVNGEYALHYTIPVKVINNSVEITEAFKEAITGGWYKGINIQLQPVECPLKTEG